MNNSNSITYDPLSLSGQLCFALNDVLSHRADAANSWWQRNLPFAAVNDHAELKVVKRLRLRQIKRAALVENATVSKSHLKHMGESLVEESQHEQHQVEQAVDIVWQWLEQAKIPYLAEDEL